VSKAYPLHNTILIGTLSSKITTAHFIGYNKKHKQYNYGISEEFLWNFIHSIAKKGLSIFFIYFKMFPTE